MAHLAHRTYRPKPPSRILFGDKAVQATTSPAHLVFMHGLLGSNLNFSSLCTSMAGLDSDARLLAEAKIGITTYEDMLVPRLSAQTALREAITPRVYNNTAFDWRSHGNSAHNPDMSLNGLSEDISSFLEIYSTRLRYEQLQAPKKGNGVECEPVEGAPPVLPVTNPLDEAASAGSEGPLPIILVAHSMGAMAMMHWMWREHINIWAHKIFLGEDSPYAESNVFRNKHYKVVGAVVIDMAPAQRPASFNDTIRIIDFLPKVPLHQLKSPQEVERWLMENGPKDVFTKHNIFQIRYQLSNIDFTAPGAPRWRIGLREIIEGLHEMLWEEGGIACIQQARDALMVANRRRIKEKKYIWERPTKFTAFPTYFVFGEESPYNTSAARLSVFEHFYQPNVVQLNKADHFMFMRHKSTFMHVLRNCCYDAEVKAKIV